MAAELVSPSLLVPALRSDLSLRALETLAARINSLPLQQAVVMDVDQVDASALNALAEQFGVLDLGWELAESDGARRALLKSAIKLQRRRGTPWAVREMIRRLGFGEVDLVEGIGTLRHDGARRHDGQMLHGGNATTWAVYRVVLKTRALTTDQAVRLRKALAAVAPARCWLASLDYRAVPIRYNAAARHSGTYTYGSG